MQVIGPNNDSLEGKWSSSAGRLEHLPKVVNVFGQEFPAAFQQRDREEEGAARNKGANILRHKSGLTQLPHGTGWHAGRRSPEALCHGCRQSKINIKNPKSGKSAEVVFIPKKLAGRLKDYLKARGSKGDQKIFPITYTAARVMVKKAGALVGGSI
jgi:hypothetical protein